MRRLHKDIRRIGLVANTEKPASVPLVRRAARLIRASGRTVLAEATTARLAGLRCATAPHLAGLARAVDLLMVFGGDGTMLRMARALVGLPTPIFGINTGGMGFLTGAQAHELPLALKQIWAGQTLVETRPIIQATGRARGQPITEPALNEFVITRGAAPRLIELEVSVDGEELTRYRCDGLIICSPTGSTAYSLSAGGAIVSPAAEVLTLTPICPHTLSNRCVIVPLDATVQVQVLSAKVDTVLSADGQRTLSLAPGDVIQVRRSRHTIRLLHLAGSSFFQTLRTKLNWSGAHV